ncbi:GNAT family N-acetyltransferase [Alsobacter sp. SYSU M60028]|uniref:GNAT family N-acetyltransferase n=1 Tax=Alsobacter ponti TaxID=2962936 RepID=A0ABT1LE52_9HYPH|nr:GNAT family N-acetyltransferase [Alsobacter ponti]MCP8939020.1 GNAT family N-acetyltransferase [Alsobacter ponti]
MTPVLHRGWTPGLLGWIVAEHGVYYEREWQLGRVFEAKVAEGLGELAARFDPARDQLLSARDGDAVLGSIVVDGGGPHAASRGARIRYFILSDAARGRGVGRLLLREALDGIRAAGFTCAWLTTFAGLDAARHLYEAHGFRLASEAVDTSWGTPLTEQTFAWSADGAP